jgi:hypothetical protein
MMTVDCKPVKKTGDALPYVSGECPWGIVSQGGRKIIITGGSSWTASGMVRDDSKVELTWTILSSGKEAMGVYSFKNGILSGQWGWMEDVDLDRDGNLSGENIKMEQFAVKEYKE